MKNPSVLALVAAREGAYAAFDAAVDARTDARHALDAARADADVWHEYDDYVSHDGTTRLDADNAYDAADDAYDAADALVARAADAAYRAALAASL